MSISVQSDRKFRIRILRFGRTPRADLPTFILHWLIVACVVASLTTGLRIASDISGGPLHAIGALLVGVLPEGLVLSTHVQSGWLLTCFITVYLVFLRTSGVHRRVVNLRQDLVILRDHLIRGRGWGRSAWLSVNRLLYSLVITLFGMLIVSGWSLYSGVIIGVEPYIVKWVHAACAGFLVVYACVHVLSVIKTGLLAKMLRPRMALLKAATIALVVPAFGLGIAYGVNGRSVTDLNVRHVDPTGAPVLDGRADESVWREAEPVTIVTRNGANFEDGQSTVEVMAAYDTDRVYFLFRWDDPQRSQKMFPLLKGERGWELLQTSIANNDENVFYEDKFAVLLSHNPTVGSGTAHLGQDLVAGPHYRNQRGLHYSEDGGIVDLWHWKSIRSGSMRPGHADDNYIGPPQPSTAAGARYTGGYTQDPTGEGHPYTLNHRVLEDADEAGAVRVEPLYLPKVAGVLDELRDGVLDPVSQDDGKWYLTGEEVVPYSVELDVFPIGTVLPGVILEGDFVGDRGDVLAEGEWNDGFWTLEVSRRLDTGSIYDVSLAGDQPVYLWTSAFNHTQTRHSWHPRPLRIVFDRAGDVQAEGDE